MEINVFQSQPGSFDAIGYDESCQLKTSNNLTQNEIYKKSYNRCCDTRTTVNNEMFYLDQYERINSCPQSKQNGMDFDNMIEAFADPSDPSNKISDKISEEQIIKIQTSKHPQLPVKQETAKKPTKSVVKQPNEPKPHPKEPHPKEPHPKEPQLKDNDKKKGKKRKNKWTDKYYDEYDQYYDYDISYFPYYFPPPIPDYVPYESPPVYPMNQRPIVVDKQYEPERQIYQQPQQDQNNTILYAMMVFAFMFLMFIIYKFLF